MTSTDDLAPDAVSAPDPLVRVPWFRSWPVFTLAAFALVFTLPWLTEELLDSLKDLSGPAYFWLGAFYILSIVPAVWRLYGYNRGLTWTGLALAVFWPLGLVINFIMGLFDMTINNAVVLEEERQFAPIGRLKVWFIVTPLLLVVSGLLSVYAALRSLLVIPSVLQLVLVAWLIGMVVMAVLKGANWLKQLVFRPMRKQRLLAGPGREDIRDIVIWIIAVGQVDYRSLISGARNRGRRPAAV